MSEQTLCSTIPDSRKAAKNGVDIPAVDGHRLGGRVYEPIGRTHATVLALPGIGVPQRVFRHVGDWLAQRGVRLVSVDYRGIGESATQDGIATASLSKWALADAVGEELPGGVAREWMRWGRSSDWLMTHIEGADARYASFSRPILAHAISDDDIAPPRAVDDLLRRFTSADVTRVDITPEALGRSRIGHVGLFRPTNTVRVWEHWLHFIKEKNHDYRN